MEQTPRRDEELEVGYILLTLRAVWEDNQYASFCDELGIASCGDTVEEAFSMLTEAIGVYLEDLADMGQLLDVLREHNVHPDFEPPRPQYRMPVEAAESSGAVAPTYQFLRHKVPAMA